MIKAIFWDNDGILVDTERLYYQANKEILATVGINVTREVYHQYFLAQSKGIWYIAREYGFSDEYIEALREKRNALHRKLLDEEDIFIDSVEDILQALDGKYNMGIVTSASREHFDLVHRSSNLLPFFDFVITNEDYTRSKPDPEPYLLALERAGCQKDECLVIEDSERGLKAARNAGMQCIVIPNELTQYGNFSGAYKILNSISELPEIL